jgi:hypothetical protein
MANVPPFWTLTVIDEFGASFPDRVIVFVEASE